MIKLSQRNGRKNMSETVIRIQGLTKYYGDKCAVDNLSLEVKKGEIFGMIGPNGAGKSTTIECLLGAKKCDSGNLSILGLIPTTKKTTQNIVLTSRRTIPE